MCDVGVFIDGQWYLDLNGNGQWDEGDLWAKLGNEGDLPVTGDWDGDGKTDIGIYGPAWARDPWAVRNEPGLPDADNYPTNPLAKTKNVPPTADEATSGGRLLKRTSQGKPRADLIDHVFHYGAPGDVPVDRRLERRRHPHDRRLPRRRVERRHRRRRPADRRRRPATRSARRATSRSIGDFNGDGVDEMGVFRDGQWIIDTNGNRQIDAHDTVFELGEAGDTPVVGDWDGDGTDDPGTYRPGVVEDRLSRRAG